MTNFPLPGCSPVDSCLTQSIYRLHYVVGQSLSATQCIDIKTFAHSRSADVLLLRNRIKLTLTVALTLTARQQSLRVGPFFPVCVSQVQMYVQWVAERLLLGALHR